MSLINPVTGSVLTGVAGGPSSVHGRPLPTGFQGGLGWLSDTVVGGQRCFMGACRLEQWDGHATAPLVSSPRAVWSFISNGHGQWAADVTRDRGTPQEVRGCEDWLGRWWPAYAPQAIGVEGLLAIGRHQAGQDFEFYRPGDPAATPWRTLSTGVRRGATLRHGRFAFTEDGRGWRVYEVATTGLVDESDRWAQCIPPSGGGAPQFCEIDGDWFVQSWSFPRRALVLYRRDDGPARAIVLTDPGELAFFSDVAAHDGQILSSGCANDRDQPGDVTLWRTDPSLRTGSRALLGTTARRELQLELVDTTTSGQEAPRPQSPDLEALIARVTALEQSERTQASTIATLTRQLAEATDATRLLTERVDSLVTVDDAQAHVFTETAADLARRIGQLERSSYRTVWSYREGFTTARIPPK